MNFHCHTLLSVISITRDSNRLLTICSHRYIHIYVLNLANQNSYTCISTFNSHLDLRYKLKINHCHFEESGVLLFEKKAKLIYLLKISVNWNLMTDSLTVFFFFSLMIDYAFRWIKSNKIE